MMNEVSVTFVTGETRMVAATPGVSLMEALRAAEQDAVLALCGGNCSCGTCHVLIDPAFFDLLPASEPSEDEMLEAVASRTAHSRLSCQLPCAILPDGLRVTIPEPDL